MTTVAALAVVACVAALATMLRPAPAARAVGSTDGPASIDEPGAIAVLEDIERDLRVGDGLVAATTVALRRHPSALPELRRSLDGGAALGTALEAATPADADERLVVQTLRACERTGGRMGAAVDRAVLVLRERRAWQREREVQAAQARLSATVLTLLPLAFAAWGVATSERIRRAYVEIPLCGVAAVIGLALNGVGWLWMRRMVRGRAT